MRFCELSLLWLCACAPEEQRLERLRVHPSSFSVFEGGTQQLVVYGTDARGERALVSGVRWTTSDPTIATVSSIGFVRAQAAGRVTISATTQAQGTDVTINVAGVVLQHRPCSDAVQVTGPSWIAVGETGAFNARIMECDGRVVDVTDRMQWSSGSSQIASINAHGIATGLAAGNTSVTGTIEGVMGTANLEVLDQVPSGLRISATHTELQRGSSASILVSAEFVYTDGSTRTANHATGLYWQSSDPLVVAIMPVSVGAELHAGSMSGTALVSAKWHALAATPITIFVR